MQRLLPVRVLIAFTVSTCLMLGACSGSDRDDRERELIDESSEQLADDVDGEPSSSGTGSDGDTFVDVDHGDAATLDPAVSYDTQSAKVIGHVYETLVGFEKGSLENIVGQLASDWAISDDGRTYRFTIREDVRFHDGRDLGAEDVAYSFRRGIVQDSSGGPQWMLLQPLFGLSVQRFADDVVEGQFGGDWVAACEALEDRIRFDASANTVTFELAAPFAPMLQILVGPWGSIVSRDWVAEQGGWDGDCATAQAFNDPAPEDNPLQDAMNGTGPFRLERWAPGEELSMLRNDDYWRREPAWPGAPTGPARFRRVVIRIVEDWGTRLAMLKAGDADFTWVDMQQTPQVDPLVAETCDVEGNCEVVDDAGSLRRHTGLTTLSADFILMNQAVDTTGGNPALGSGKLDGNGVPPDFFADIHVRKAFNFCFDWDVYIDDVLLGEAEQTKGPIIAGMPGWRADQPTYAHDLAECESEFKSAALRAEDGRTLWDTGFRLQMIYETGGETRRATLEILRDNLSRVNPRFQAELVEKPWPEVLAELSTGRMPIVNIGWIEDYHDPHNWVTPTMTRDGAWASALNLDDAFLDVADGLVLEGIAEIDPVKRAGIYEELQQLAHENAIGIWLAQARTRRYEQRSIAGWYFHPLFPPSAYYLERRP